jgi:hypothetical protein
MAPQYVADILTQGFSFLCMACSNSSDSFYRFGRFVGLLVNEVMRRYTEARKEIKENERNLSVKETSRSPHQRIRSQRSRLLP